MSLKSQAKFISSDILFVLRLLIGFVLIVVGFVDLFIPLLPDVILIIIGLMFFDVNGKIARKIVRLFPISVRSQISKYTLKTEGKIDKILGRLG